MAGHRIIFGNEFEYGKPSGIKRYSQQLGDALAHLASSERQLERVHVRPRLRPLVASAWAAGIPVPFAREHTIADNQAAKSRERLPKNLDVSVTAHSVSLLTPPRLDAHSVVTVHDLVPLTHPQFLTKRGAAWHQKMLRRVVFSDATLIAPTEAVREQLIAHFDTVPLSSRIHVVGGATSLPKPTPQKWANQLASPYIVFVGMFEPRKRIDALIRALAHLPDLSLVLVGSMGWGGVHPRQIASNSAIDQSRMTIVHDADDQRLADIVASAEVLVLPSEVEGFGLPLVEAMALETPVVHSNDPALCEVTGGASIVAQLCEDDSHYAQNLAEAIQLALTQRHELRTLGLQRSTALSWMSSAERVWNIHSQL